MNGYERMFWRFVADRQMIWWKRATGAAEPWTDDPVLQSLTFTNVYRHLDRGTMYMAEEILENPAYGRIDTLFNVLFYRRFNFVETHAELVREMGPLTTKRLSERYALDELEEVLRARHQRGDKLCTGAYQSNLNPPLGGKDLAQNLRRFAEIYKDFAWAKSDSVETDSVQQSFEAVRSATGIGDFLGYQVLGDLLTPAKKWGTSFLGLDPNAWAQLGPGARKAMKLLYPGFGKDNQLRAAKKMVELQDHNFCSAGASWLPLTAIGNREIPLTLIDVEHALCEFMKYARATEGSTEAKRKYKPAPPGSWRPSGNLIPFYR
jgi:hypothetical protein